MTSKEISFEEAVREYTTHRAKTEPLSIHLSLSKGDLVRKAFFGNCYKIDDPLIYKRLGPARNLDEIFEKIHTQFTTGNPRAFGNREIMDYSEVFNGNIGECTEKAIIFQLWAQGNNVESIIVNETFKRHNQHYISLHTYNIIFIDDIPWIFDTSAILVDKDGKNKPYKRRILDINPDENYRLILEDHIIGGEYFC